MVEIITWLTCCQTSGKRIQNIRESIITTLAADCPHCSSCFHIDRFKNSLCNREAICDQTPEETQLQVRCQIWHMFIWILIQILPAQTHQTGWTWDPGGLGMEKASIKKGSHASSSSPHGLGLCHFVKSCLIILSLISFPITCYRQHSSPWDVSTCKPIKLLDLVYY